MSGSRGRRALALAARAGWLILPVIAAGLAHLVVLKIDALHRLAMPIDGGKRWRGQPLFGSNKTWRGVVVMTAFTASLTYVQSMVGRNRRDRVLSVTRDYRTSSWIAGGILGLSYCLAELPNSFVKRRIGIPPGVQSTRATWLQYSVDQVDSVLGCLVALRSFYRPHRGETCLAFVFGTVVHVGVDCLLYMIGVKRRDG